jgi:hypothetical protein
MGTADMADRQDRSDRGAVPMLILRWFQVLDRSEQVQRNGHCSHPAGLNYTAECRPFPDPHALGHRDTLFRNGNRYRRICQYNGGTGGTFGMTKGKPPSLFLPFSTPYVQPFILTETSVLLLLIFFRWLQNEMSAFILFFRF